MRIDVADYPSVLSLAWKHPIARYAILHQSLG